MTTVQILMNLMQTIVALLLALNCFHRLTKTNVDTYREIRYSFSLLLAISLMVAGAPWFGHRPSDQLDLLLISNLLLLQASTTRHWRYQVPRAFQQQAMCQDAGSAI